jgi:hypothetical protein
VTDAGKASLDKLTDADVANTVPVKLVIDNTNVDVLALVLASIVLVTVAVLLTTVTDPVLTPSAK